MIRPDKLKGGWRGEIRVKIKYNGRTDKMRCFHVTEHPKKIQVQSTEIAATL